MRLNLTAAVVAVGLCLLVAGVSEAAVRIVSWTHPTTNTDGSALPVSQITRTTVAWGPSETDMPNTKVVTGTATSTTIDLAPGTWVVAAKTTANGNDSNYSRVVQVVTVQAVVAGINMAPAYKLLADGSRSQVVAGFVKVGTACSGPTLFSYRNRGYRLVENKSVLWWSPTLADVRNPPPVAAPCA
jgi:hypothetical protein